MFDFGMNVYSTFFIILKKYYPHNLHDVYDPNHPTLGNTNIAVNGENIELLDENSKGVEEETGNKKGPRLLDWLFTLHVEQDLRMGFLRAEGGKVYHNVDWSPCRIYQISPISNRPVCYTTEALKYAQTGFFFGIVICQFYNSLACKSRKISLKDQGLKNYFMVFGWASEFVLCICLAYIEPINTVLGTRDLILPHFFLPAVPFGLLMLFYDELRKFLIRHYPSDDPKHANWFERNVCY